MRVHFIAIGGSVMHNLAIALHKKGVIVSGSDDYVFEPSKSRLKKYNLLPEKEGWYPEIIDNKIDAIILGMHAKKDNPELLKAQDFGLKVYSFPEFVYEQLKQKTRVVIAGSHGKTTVTAMILHVLKYMEREEDYLVGAQLEGYETMVNFTKQADYAILEGDEYLSSPLDNRPKFLHYYPNVALITGISWDHINVFPSFDIYVLVFEQFIKSMVNGGILIYNSEDSILQDLVKNTPHHIRKIPYQSHPYKIFDGVTQIETSLGLIPLEIFGQHNMSNLMGAKWVCQQIGIDEEYFYEAIPSFKGASKRLECIAKNENTIVFKDFAHAPSKVKATTEAVKAQYPNKKLIAFLELHTYSSLNKDFINQYSSCLEQADEVVVFYIPKTLAIKKLDPLNSKDIEQSFGHSQLQIFTASAKLEEHITHLNNQNVALLFMSSGNFGGIGLEKLLGLSVGTTKGTK